MLNPLAYSVALDVTTGPDALWTDAGELLDPGSLGGGTMTLILVQQGAHWVVRGVQLDRT